MKAQCLLFFISRYLFFFTTTPVPQWSPFRNLSSTINNHHQNPKSKILSEQIFDQLELQNVTDNVHTILGQTHTEKTIGKTHYYFPLKICHPCSIPKVVIPITHKLHCLLNKLSSRFYSICSCSFCAHFNVNNLVCSVKRLCVKIALNSSFLYTKSSNGYSTNIQCTWPSRNHSENIGAIFVSWKICFQSKYLIWLFSDLQ